MLCFLNILFQQNPFLLKESITQNALMYQLRGKLLYVIQVGAGLPS